MHDLTYANGFAELLAPVLAPIRATGFFEAYVFIPAMTALSIAVFVSLRRRAWANGTFVDSARSRFPKLFQLVYFTLCFMVTNSTAVAFKTMIVEETDYETRVWFLPWVSPLHFYIASVATAMIWLIWRNRSTLPDCLLCLYAQFGLLAGYYVAYRRLVYEPFEWHDVTTGMSGVFLTLWFGLLNWDIAIRYFRTPYERDAVTPEIAQ